MPHKDHVDKSGNILPSVTQVLDIVNKPYLCLWYGKLGIKKATALKEAAGLYGRNVHAGIEAHITNTPVQLELSPIEKTSIESALEWVETSSFQPIKVEFSYTSDNLGFGGTCDAIGYFKPDSEHLYVIDWKTSNNMGSTYGMQLAAYAMLFQESSKYEEPMSGGILHISKKRKGVEFHEFPDLSGYKKAFLAALKLYNHVRAEEARLGLS